MAFDTLDSLESYGRGFAINATEADLTGCEPLLAAPGAGKNIYLEKVVISCATATNVTIGEGESSSAVENEIFGPIMFLADGTTNIVVDFKRPIQLTANKALTADAAGAGQVTIFVEGFVK